MRRYAYSGLHESLIGCTLKSPVHNRGLIIQDWG